MGHTEKCVSKAVEDVIQEEEMIKVSIIKSKSVEYKYRVPTRTGKPGHFPVGKSQGILIKSQGKSLKILEN